MQHRSPDGAFHADLAPIAAENRVVVVPDVDAILRRDAPFARADQTELRLTAGSSGFVGMAIPADIAAYLTGVNYTEVSGLSLGRGPLAVATRTITATGEPLAPPSEQTFWLRGGTGELRWTPTTDRDRHLALIIIAPPGDTPVHLSVDLTAGWLNSTTWGLLILGPILLMLGLAALAWPQRPREIVYVVDTPTAAQAGLPLPAPRSFPLSLPAQSRPAIPAALPASSASFLPSPTTPISDADPASLAPAPAFTSPPASAFTSPPASAFASAPASGPRASAPAASGPPASPTASSPDSGGAPTAGAPETSAAPAGVSAAFGESLTPSTPTASAAPADVAPAFGVSPAAGSAAASPAFGDVASAAIGSSVVVSAVAGVPVAGGMPTASAYRATAVSSSAAVQLPAQLVFQPSDSSWPPAESPTTTEPAREIPTQELPLVDPEYPMPTSGVQLHLAKPN
jgi:hypothetical protein